MIKNIIKIPLLPFIALTILLGIVIAYSLSFLFNINGGLDNVNDAEKLPKEIFFFLAIVIAPLFETFVFQYLIFKFFVIKERNFDNKKIFFLFITSSLLFSLTHVYSIEYFFYSFFLGLYFITVFFLSIYIRNDKNFSFLVVFLIHLIINFLAILDY